MYGYEFIADIDGCGSDDSAKENTTESTTDVLVGLKKAGVAVEVMALKQQQGLAYLTNLTLPSLVEYDYNFEVFDAIDRRTERRRVEEVLAPLKLKLDLVGGGWWWWVVQSAV
jgi:hypothetical protein